MNPISQEFHCERVILDGAEAVDTRVTVTNGVITRIVPNASPVAGEARLGTVVPGFVNAHSHAFHRGLRGHTHADGGDFWQWRQRMYEMSDALTPEGYYTLAQDVFSEMRDVGYTAVGEFHYVHHRRDGRPYPNHDMELAVAEAAAGVGIRLVLLDTCYLQGGIGLEVSAEQKRFRDAGVASWLDRWHRLREKLGAVGSGYVSLGAAIHSVRAVSREDLATIATELPATVPLHAHVSEQVAENVACLNAYGMTPVELFAECGLLSERFSAVHATHLSEHDQKLLGDAGATVVMCPTTEADLGDGVGPAPELLASGVRIAIGSDQHAVVDPWEELARLELDQRLRSRRRGVFTPAQLWTAGTVAGNGSLGLSERSGTVAGFVVGDHFDAVEVSTDTARTRGAELLQYPLVARGSDVTATIVGGRLSRPKG